MCHVTAVQGSALRSVLLAACIAADMVGLVLSSSCSVRPACLRASCRQTSLPGTLGSALAQPSAGRPQHSTQQPQPKALSAQVDTLPTGEIDYDHFAEALAQRRARPAIVNVNVGTTVKVWPATCG